MIDFFQSRITSKEYIGLFIGTLVAIFAANYITSNFIIDDPKKKETLTKRLINSINFSEGQRNEYANVQDPAKMKGEISRITTKLEKLGMTSDSEITKSKKANKNFAENEILAGTVISMLQRSNLYIVNAGKKGGANQERAIQAEGTYKSLIKALKGLEKLNIGVSEVSITKNKDNDFLNVNLRIIL